MIERFIPYRVHWFLRITEAVIFLSLVGFIVGFIIPATLPPQSLENTFVKGIIIRSQVWQGTITVSGDIVTMPQTTITVLPGTKILVNSTGDKSNFDLIPWHLNSGINTGPSKHGIEKGEPFWDEKNKIQLHLSHFLAKGTFRSPITLSSNLKSNSSYDMNLITVSEGELSFVNLSNYRRLEIGSQVKINNSLFNKTGECAVCINNGSPQIINNQFKDGQKFFIIVGDASPLISDNSFTQGNGGVVFTQNTSGRAEIKLLNNYFQLGSKNAISIVPLDEGGAIVNNTFSSGNLDLPCNSAVVIKQNQILSQVNFRAGPDCVGKYIFDYNFWGLTNEKDILNSRIIGATDNFKVKVPYILLTPPAKE